jgi:hypothetical protein
MFFKSPISRDSLIGKFQNFTEMKVNCPNNKINTELDFSDNFHNIKNFVQLDHFENISKNLVISSFDRSRKTTGGRKNFAITKNECIYVSTRLLCKKFKEIGLLHASQLKLKPNRQFL